jgi:hypothetical protein
MSESTLRPARSAASAAGLLACLFAAGPAAAQQPAGNADAPVATCQAVSGVLLQRAQPGKDWTAVEPKDGVRAGALLVALPEADLVSANGAVRLKMLTDIGKRGPFPVLESALHCNRPDGDVDLDVTFDRGIVGFANLKEKGAARVRLRVGPHVGIITLNEPGTTVGMEIYGRMPPGAPVFEKDGKGQWEVKVTPIVDLFVVVRKGSAYIQSADKEWRLAAPPGPAVIHWNSLSKEADVQRLDKLPPSLLVLTPEEEKLQKELCACAHALTSGPLDKGLQKLLTSDSEVKRRAGVVALGALDKVPELLAAVNDPKHTDVRDQAVLVLRHWVGRAPGQATKLYQEATKLAKISPVQAKNRLHLLVGFTDEEHREPGTYELLLAFLNHQKLGIRHLAHWHLVRLVPQGAQIGFDAAAPAEERARAVARWRALIPEGRLPPNLARPGDKK